MRIPEAALTIFNMLTESGYDTYFVGGCLRDLLMGRQPHDYDLATAASPSQTLAVFDSFSCYREGEKFGTIGVRFNDTVYEITTFRSDGEYTDARHPEQVSYVSDINSDLARRDFTVNSIAYSPLCGIIDPFCGEADIKNKLIKATGDPEKRFSEDALRILRMFRFSAKLGFEIDAPTFAAAVELKPLIARVAAERVREELLGIIETDCSVMQRMARLGFLEFAGIEAPKTDLLERRLPRDTALRTACLCVTSGITPATLRKSLKLSNEFYYRCRAFFDRLTQEPPSDEYTLKTRLEPLSFDDWRSICAVYDAMGLDGSKTLALLDIIENGGQPYKIGQLAINGDTLRENGLVGKQIGNALNCCLELVRRQPEMNDKKALLEFVLTKACKNDCGGIEYYRNGGKKNNA